MLMSVLNGQIALVTGASGGIGSAIASALARSGAHVYLAGRNKSKLEALAARLRQAGAAVQTVAADLLRDADNTQLAARIAGSHGRLDVLVHAAGVYARGKTEVASVNVFDRMYATNLRGPYILTQQVLSLLKKPRGQVVFINSSVGLNARAGVSQYSAMHHAFRAIADALREEVNADNVRVMSVYPGRTATPIIEKLANEEGQPYRPELLLQPEDIAAIVTSALALPWTAEVTDIAIRPMKKS